MFNFKHCLFVVFNQQVWKASATVLLLLAALALPAKGQTLNKEYTNNNTDQAMRGSFQVDPSTLGMSFSVTLGGYPGRGLNLPIALSYNSKIWRMKHRESITGGGIGSVFNNSIPKFAENTTAGWTTSLGVPWVEITGSETPYDQFGDPLCNNCLPTPPSDTPYYVERVTLHMPDGSSHELRKNDLAIPVPPGTYPSPVTFLGDFVAVDSSRIRMTLSNYQRIIYLPDGSRYVQDYAPYTTPITQFIDRFGNTLTHDDTTQKWTDTMGREIGLMDDNGVNAFDNSTAGIRSIKLPGLGNVPQTRMEYILVWKQLANALTPIPGTNPPQYPALRYDGSRYGAQGNQPPPQTLAPALFTSTTYDRVFANLNTLFNPVVLGEIILPNGLKYIFTYNEFGELDKVTLPSSGSQSITYAQIAPLDPDSNNFPYNQANRGVIQQRICPLASCTSAQEQVLTLTAAQQTLQVQANPNVFINAYVTTVTNPTGAMDKRHHYTGGGSNIDYGFDDTRAGKALEERTYKANGQLIRRALTEWVTSGPLPGGDGNANRNPRAIRQIEILVDGNSTGQAKTTTLEYDADLNVSKTRYYDFVSVSAPDTAYISSIGLGSFIRREDTRYLVSDPCLTSTTQTSYRNRNLIALPTLQLIRKADSAPASACAVESPSDVVAANSYTYDEQGTYAPLVYLTPPIQWNSLGTTALGVTTSVKKWLNAIEDANGQTQLNTYPSGAWLQTNVKPDVAGNITKTWDARGKLSEIFYGDSFTDYTDHLTCAYPTTIYTPVPDATNTHGTNQRLVMTNVYDYWTGKVTHTTDANGQYTTFDYEPVFLRLKQVNRSDGGCTKYEYNDAPGASACDAYVKTRTLQSGPVATGVYVEDYTFFDALGRPWRTAHGEGNNQWSIRDTQYDIFESSAFTDSVLRKVEKVSNPFIATGTTLPNKTNVLFNTTDQTCTAYDEVNRVLKVRTPDMAVVVSAYNTNQVTVTDQAGNTRRSVTDGLGRLTQVYEAPTASNYLTLYAYDVLGNLLKVDQRGVNQAQAGQCRFFMYDSLSRLIRVRQPEQDVNTSYNLTEPVTTNSQWAMKYVYDANGNLLKRCDARGVKTDYSYDDLNRAVTTSYTTTSTTAVATPMAERFYDGVTNGKGKLWKSISYNLHPITSQTASQYTETNSFDAVGRPLTGTQKFMTGATTYSFPLSRTYDLTGHVLIQNYPMAGRSTTSSYNAGGRLSGVTGTLSDGVTRTYADQLAYNAAGQMTSERFGTQTQLFHTSAYNNRFQLAEVCLGSVANTPDRGKLRFFYGNAMRTAGDPYYSGTDNNGNVAQVEHVIPSAGTYRDQYDYDALNRITQARDYWVTGSTTQIYQQTYTIDAWGNRTINSGQTWGGVNSLVFTVPQVSGVPATNRFNELSYDFAGNVTTDNTTGGSGALQFDAEHRLTRAITGAITSHYVYDGDGRRVRRIVSGIETWHVYGFEGELLAEYPVTSGAPSSYPQREYGYRGGDMLVVAGCDVARWLVKDHLGTPRMLADVTGSLAGLKRHDYLPYGEEVPTSLRSSAYGYAADCVRQDFTTYERDDETGLDYAQARYYASKQGRFISVDPDPSSGGEGDPQSWNRYSYVGNHPTVLTDPTGLIWYYDRGHNKFVWADYSQGQAVLDSLGWVEITAATWSVVRSSDGSTLYQSAGGSLILLSNNSPLYRNLTAEFLQEARLQRIQAAKENAEAWANAILLDFIGKSIDGAAAVLSGGTSVTLKAVAKEVIKNLAQEYVQARLEEATGGVYTLPDPDTEEAARSGRSNDLDRREGEHGRDPELGQYKFRVEYRTDDYAEQRGLEQHVHEQYNPPLNKKRPIDPRNKNAPIYREAARKVLKR